MENLKLAALRLYRVSIIETWFIGKQSSAPHFYTVIIHFIHQVSFLGQETAK